MGFRSAKIEKWYTFVWISLFAKLELRFWGGTQGGVHRGIHTQGCSEAQRQNPLFPGNPERTEVQPPSGLSGRRFNLPSRADERIFEEFGKPFWDRSWAMRGVGRELLRHPTTAFRSLDVAYLTPC